MAINVIGSGERRSFVRVPGAKKPDASGERSSTATEFSTDGIEHGSNSADSGDKPDTSGEATSVDPASYSSSGDSSGDAPFGYTKSGRRRNRPVGSGARISRAAPADKTKASNAVASWVCMLHGVVANIVKVPALKISLEDSVKLTDAAMEVAELYDVPMPTEKVAAWMNLGSVAYKVYFVNDKPKPVLVSKREQVEEEMPIPDFMRPN